MSNFFVTFSEIRSFSGRTLILQNDLRKISVPNDQFSPHNSSALRFLSLLKKKTLDFGHFSSCTFLLLKIFIRRIFVELFRNIFRNSVVFRPNINFTKKSTENFSTERPSFTSQLLSPEIFEPPKEKNPRLWPFFKLHFSPPENFHHKGTLYKGLYKGLSKGLYKGLYKEGRKIFHTTSVALAENRFIKKYCGSWKLDPGRGGGGHLKSQPLIYLQE